MQASELTALGPMLYFAAYDRINTNQLWQYNTSTGSMTEVTTGSDFAPTGAWPMPLLGVGSTLYFTGAVLDPSGHFNGLAELWRYDGSGSPIEVTQGTGLLRDLRRQSI